VQGAGTAVELRGALRVTKDFRAPLIVSGTIETVRGFATFYGKKFILEQGRVTFPGTEEINPLLDVTTTYAVSEYVVSIQVEGSALKPQLTLSSQPEREQSDIVSLLVFGKTTDRLTTSEQSSLSSQAQAVAGSVAASQLEKIAGTSLGLDVIEVTPGEGGALGGVGVGRYITQDIFLSYKRQFGHTGGNKVGVEYSLKRNLKLKGTSSDLGESAVDFLWQIEY
jgi:translocation and assembly module TamB